MGYFYSDSNNQTVGPVDAAGLQRLLNVGAIHPQTWIMEEGETEWKPLSSLMGGPSCKVVAGTYGNLYVPAPTIANPYSVPVAQLGGPSRASVQQMPGIGRRACVLWMLGFLAVPLAVGMVWMRTEGALFDCVAGIGIIVLCVIFLGKFIVAAQRLRNIGWSWALSLLLFFPIANFWVFAVCLILPAAYAEHKRIDRGGKWMICMIILFFAAFVALTYLLASGKIPIEKWWPRQEQTAPSDASAPAKPAARAEGDLPPTRAQPRRQRQGRQ